MKIDKRKMTYKMVNIFIYFFIKQISTRNEKRKKEKILLKKKEREKKKKKKQLRLFLQSINEYPRGK
jgi:hypothetical protein